MRLSEQLKRDNECGDFLNALEGYSDRAKKLEDALWFKCFFDAGQQGGDYERSKSFADKTLAELNK